MQAGDRLQFIPPIEFIDITQPDRREQFLDARETFSDLCRALFQRFQDEMRAAQFTAETRDFSIVEISLKVKAGDGSYLHIVVFSTKDDRDRLTFNVSIIEHNPSDLYLSGILYGTEDDRVVRTVLSAPDTDEDTLDDVTFFSAIDYFSSFSELNIHPDLDEEDLDERDAVKKEVLNELENLYLDEEMGFNRIPVAVEEIDRIAQLLMDVESFPLITE